MTIKDSIKIKLYKYIEKVGELKYTIEEHPIVNDVKKANILELKILIDKLKNNNYIVLVPLISSFRLIKIENKKNKQNCSTKEFIEHIDIRKIAITGSKWVKLKDKDFKDTISLVDFFKNRVIYYAIINNYKIPKMKFTQLYSDLVMYSDFEYIFSDEELQYMEEHCKSYSIKCAKKYTEETK